MKTLLTLSISLALGATSLLAQQAAAPARGRAAAAPAAQAGPPTAPLPAGAKIAFVNVQYIAANSTEGKAANARVSALVQKKQGEIAASQKNPQDAQRIQQEAQTEVQKLQTDLQNEFQKKLFPVLQQMAQEKHLSVLLSAADAGLIWAEPGLDLTAEAIKRFDAATAAKPAAK
jgi:Skp family chaperone for outer membrane proteins